MRPWIIVWTHLRYLRGEVELDVNGGDAKSLSFDFTLNVNECEWPGCGKAFVRPHDLIVRNKL